MAPHFGTPTCSRLAGPKAGGKAPVRCRRDGLGGAFSNISNSLPTLSITPVTDTATHVDQARPPPRRIRPCRAARRRLGATCRRLGSRVRPGEPPERLRAVVAGRRQPGHRHLRPGRGPGPVLSDHRLSQRLPTAAGQAGGARPLLGRAPRHPGPPGPLPAAARPRRLPLRGPVPPSTRRRGPGAASHPHARPPAPLAGRGRAAVRHRQPAPAGRRTHLGTAGQCRRRGHRAQLGQACRPAPRPGLRPAPRALPNPQRLRHHPRLLRRPAGLQPAQLLRPLRAGRRGPGRRPHRLQPQLGRAAGPPAGGAQERAVPAPGRRRAAPRPVPAPPALWPSRAARRAGRLGAPARRRPSPPRRARGRSERRPAGPAPGQRRARRAVAGAAAGPRPTAAVGLAGWRR
jgi:hypothetical protein